MLDTDLRQPTLVAGIDEAGRGPLAGPVTAACVIFPAGYSNSQIGDSKKISPSVRKKLYEQITADALAFSIVSIGARRIDLVNILRATKLAMILSAKRAINDLRSRGIHDEVLLLIDGNQKLDTDLPQRTIIRGDATEISIGAASILAKVTRDRLMGVLDQKYPGYGLAGHKGYGTKTHLEQLRELGPSPIHRRSFAGVCTKTDLLERTLDRS